MLSAVGGAAAGGLVGALVGLGLSEEDARYYEGQVREGKTLVAVDAGDRPDEARDIVRRHGGYDRATAPGPTGAAAGRRV